MFLHGLYVFNAHSDHVQVTKIFGPQQGEKCYHYNEHILFLPRVEALRIVIFYEDHQLPELAFNMMAKNKPWPHHA